MGRETIKSLKENIENLEQQLIILSEQNGRLIKQADQDFLNSYVYRELSEKVQFLQNYIKTLENENQALRNKLKEKDMEIARLLTKTAVESALKPESLFLLNEGITKQNRKNAGRKPLLSVEQQEKIWFLRSSGLSMRAIAEQIGCSVATVHRILSRPGK